MGLFACKVPAERSMTIPELEIVCQQPQDCHTEVKTSPKNSCGGQNWEGQTTPNQKPQGISIYDVWMERGKEMHNHSTSLHRRILLVWQYGEHHSNSRYQVTPCTYRKKTENLWENKKHASQQTQKYPFLIRLSNCEVRKPRKTKLPSLELLWAIIYNHRFTLSMKDPPYYTNSAVMA